MWQGGPLREWSDEKQDGFISYEDPKRGVYGFAGDYVCDDCGETFCGVYQYRGKWICGGICMEQVDPAERERLIA
jgi:hypothetical protein